MSNDTQDKQFLALELTKIFFNDKVRYKPKDIYETYTYFLTRLHDLTDMVETTVSLKSEVERLQKENERLKTDNQAVLKPLICDITTIANGCRGDMEPYVYEAIISNCRRYER